MPEFEIVQVSEDEPRQWHTKDGKAMLSYEVEFSGDQGAGFADVNKLATSKAPSVGEVYDELKPGFGDKKATLKKAWKQEPPGQKSFGGGGGKNPTERAEIRRMAAQKAAVETFRAYVELRIAAGKTADFVDQKPFEVIEPLIELFDKDAREAGERA